MSNHISSFFLIVFAMLYPLSFSEAALRIQYDQSLDFWSVLGKIQNGVGDIPAANALLNQTYGKPVGAEVSLVYQQDEPDLSTFTVREVRIDQVGYAVSSNPVFPRLFGWEGFGPVATVGYQFLELYGGRFFGKRAEAVSTDLIDRRLVDVENITLLGGGIHYELKETGLFDFPTRFAIYTRHTQFISSALPNQFYNRWRVQVDAVPNDIDIFLIAGQNPIPGFDHYGLIWHYLWNIETFPDFMSAWGVGVKSPVLAFWQTQALFGYFGGYVGGRLETRPLSFLKLDLHSYGLETTSAYHASELRLFGVDLSFDL